MGTFTIPLKRVIELTGGTVEIVDGRTVISGTNIGLENYPIYDEAYRPTLNGLIVDHYWNQEIGVESVDMFQLAMRRKMNEIMPYYNELYKSTQIVFDPLSTIDITTVSSGTSANTSSSENTNASDSETISGSRSVSSETPQTMLSGDADYATAAADSNAKSTATASSTDSVTATLEGEDASESHVSGYQGIAADLMLRYRESLMNVDLMVIEELKELFMSVWNNGDEYSNGVEKW